MKAPKKNKEWIEEYEKGSSYEAIQQYISDSAWGHTCRIESIRVDELCKQIDEKKKWTKERD